MKKVFAKTSNVTRFVAAVNRLSNCGERIPKMMLMYGRYGTGRTETAYWYIAQNPDAIYIRSLSNMTSRWLLASIIGELGEEPYGQISKLWEQLNSLLLEKKRILFFDEIDYLARDSRVIETLRDIHDVTGTPIVFIGMEHAEKKLMRYKHLFDRFSEILKFEELNESDLSTVADTLCEVKITDDAIKYLYNEREVRRFRPLITAIYKAEGIARANTLKEVTAAHLRGVRK